ncbi:hypothetical protein [Paraburkholderia sediminicola]
MFDDLFGWLHLACGSTGIVLCNPFDCDAWCVCTSLGSYTLSTNAS